MKAHRIILILILIFPFEFLQAEYRAFLLQKKNMKTQFSQEFLSTLDPEQYQTYFPLLNDETLTYIETWRCYGRTDFFKPICQKPPTAKNPTQKTNKIPPQ